MNDYLEGVAAFAATLWGLATDPATVVGILWLAALYYLASEAYRQRTGRRRRS